jgi:hypothetical protein
MSLFQSSQLTNLDVHIGRLSKGVTAPCESCREANLFDSQGASFVLMWGQYPHMMIIGICEWHAKFSPLVGKLYLSYLEAEQNYASFQQDLDGLDWQGIIDDIAEGTDWIVDTLNEEDDDEDDTPF